jgi:GNAT superfamily N-acetyltransferase
LILRRLNEDKRATLVAHFLALSVKDRYLRFGSPFGTAAIASYVDRIDFDRDAVFGVHDDQLALVGAAHVAFEHDLAEVALTVLPDHRAKGVGSALFRRAVSHARNCRIPRLFMHFLSGNTPIMRIARKFGMEIVPGATDTDAYLKLQPTLLETQETKLTFV